MAPRLLLPLPVMNKLSPRALLIVTLLAPSVAFAATSDASSSQPPAKHHRRMDGVIRAVAGGIGGVAATTHGSPAPSTQAPQVSANGATMGTFGNGSGTGNGSKSQPTPGSRPPATSSGSPTTPGRTPAPTHGGTYVPVPQPPSGGGFSRNGGNGGSTSTGSVDNGSGLSSVQQTLSTIEQAALTAAIIYNILRSTDVAHGPHIPLPTHRTDPGTRGSSTSSTSTDGTDGTDDSTDDSSSDTTDDSTDTTDSSSTTASSTGSTSSSTHSPTNEPSTSTGASSTASSSSTGSVTTGKNPSSTQNDPSSNDSPSSVASSSTGSAPASGTPLKSPSSGSPADGSSCELSKTKLPSVLDGTNAYCPTCVKGALDKLGDGVTQANTLAAGAMRERDTIEQIVKIEETGVASGDYGAISSDGAKMEYGAYQFSRASGQLQGVLRSYIQMEGADPKSVGVLKSYLHTLESGAPLTGDHVFTDALRQAAKDPMMKKAQDAYFERTYLIPAVADASKMGLRSPLAAAVLVDLKTNGGYDSVVAAAKKAVPTIASADDEKKFIGALLDARDARYKALAAKADLGRYLKTWMARDKDFRDILASGNTDLSGEVKLANGSFCGGNGDDSRAFSLFMAKQQQGATGTPSSTGTPALASI